jgi:hypothetical protein
MNKKIPSVVAISLIIIAASAVAYFSLRLNRATDYDSIQAVKNVSQPKQNDYLVGGQCDYEKVAGTCQINSIASDGTVKFSFSPNTPVQNENFSETLKREQTDALASLAAGQSLDVKTGDTVNCEASLIKSGTCTPITFKFTKK